MLDLRVFNFLKRSPVPALIHPSCRASVWEGNNNGSGEQPAGQEKEKVVFSEWKQ